MFVMPSQESRAPETQIAVMGALLLGVLATVWTLATGTDPVQALHVGGVVAAGVVALAARWWHVPVAAALSCAVQYIVAVLAGVLLLALSVGRGLVGTRRTGGAL
jgi:hypothetical protein